LGRRRRQVLENKGNRSVFKKFVYAWRSGVERRHFLGEGEKRGLRAADFFHKEKEVSRSAEKGGECWESMLIRGKLLPSVV